MDGGGLRIAAAASSSLRRATSWNIPETRLLSLFQYGSKCAMVGDGPGVNQSVRAEWDRDSRDRDSRA